MHFEVKLDGVSAGVFEAEDATEAIRLARCGGGHFKTQEAVVVDAPEEEKSEPKKSRKKADPEADPKA